MDSVDPEAQQLGSVAPNAEGAFIRSQWIFTGLQVLGGQIALPVLLATFICVKGLQRNFVIKSFCLTWIISSISYCLELYAFHFVLPKFRNDNILEPSTDVLCLHQAALINGCLTITLIAYLFSSVTYFIVFLLEVSILFKLKQRARDFGKEYGASLSHTFVRMGIFSIYRTIIILAVPLQILSMPGTAFLGENNSPGTWFDILDATGPLMAFLILASRLDVRAKWNVLLPSERAALKRKVVIEALENGGEHPNISRLTVQFSLMSNLASYNASARKARAAQHCSTAIIA
ncbi:hypothetical protein SISNIDRAFT_490077 [Sistotremastrum niveocremeum HHB9708]|uniref:Uncharacterized protein n=1 Tax=Sistotremastrum niveocremeum HHB9708 TaxID=1314777 RepID=A0A164P8L5_9AGAM|nr:hypothetical protein SISNIDRAFT_490077 [Sistotremastrum niveocremeum HHB9708]